MIEIIDIQDTNIFGLRIDGKFDTKDVKRVFDALAEKAKGNDKFQVYYEIGNLDLSGISREMIKEEFKSCIKIRQSLPIWKKRRWLRMSNG